MSYILDALRRADSERERGAIQGLHAQPVPPGSSIGLQAADARRWLWIGVGIVAAVATTIVWNLLFAEAPPDAAQLAAASRAAAEPPAAAARAVPSPPATAPPVVPPVVTSAAPAPRPPPERVAAVPAKREPNAVAPTPRGTPTAPARPVATAPAAAPLAAADTKRPSPAPLPQSGEGSGRIHAMSELPESIRRELPSLAIGGSVYSDNPANRMLIVNGQLLQEGAQPAPELLIEQIKPRAAVLKYKGYRYEIAY